LLHRVASRGALNAPWGVALAPAGFGRFGNSLLIGNFGDGRINAYEPVLRFPLGSLRGQDHHPIQIDGLWGIAFGNGMAGQPVDSLFFAAGPAGESHGLYGRLDPVNDDE
ncbi:MAG: TIGR03118 family protein, partial [Lysobacterales bacterium]